jgi:hypothetical protein
MASDVGCGISKLLDTKPAVSIALTRLKLLIRDNWPWPG